MHRLLARQVQKTLGRLDGHSPEVQRLLEAIDAAYEQADEDRAMLERSMELSSTELVGRNAELTTAEEKYRSIFENATEGIFQLDAQGLIKVANPALASILGAASAEGLLEAGSATALFDAMPPGQWELLLERGTLQLSDLPLSRLDGAKVVVSICMRVHRDRSGAPQRIDGTLRDVTARFQAESERNELHQKLVEASRCAGRAEVATGVLHNVGNVLNSLNVSVAVMARRVEGLKLASLDKAARLLRNLPAEERGRFISQDPKGSRIPDFLVQLSENLVGDQQAIAAELGTVQQHLDHVKGVIALQQSYARAAGLNERVGLTQVIDETLRLESAGIQRHGLRVERVLDANPELIVDKHQVLQILVNLVTNAKQAMSDVGAAERLLRVRSGWLCEEGGVFIEIEDSGVGIRPDHLTRIFSHGFTTKVDGHGFGLHSSANAAKAMGGALSARSAGPGLGACFRLELPAACVAACSAAAGTTTRPGAPRATGRTIWTGPGAEAWGKQ